MFVEYDLYEDNTFRIWFAENIATEISLVYHESGYLDNFFMNDSKKFEKMVCVYLDKIKLQYRRL